MGCKWVPVTLGVINGEGPRAIEDVLNAPTDPNTPNIWFYGVRVTVEIPFGQNGDVNPSDQIPISLRAAPATIGQITWACGPIVKGDRFNQRTYTLVSETPTRIRGQWAVYLWVPPEHTWQVVVLGWQEVE
jgi:hypothetical protein